MIEEVMQLGDTMIQKTVKHEREVVEALDRIAKEEGVEVAKLIRRATRQYVQDWEAKRAA